MRPIRSYVFFRSIRRRLIGRQLVSPGLHTLTKLAMEFLAERCTCAGGSIGASLGGTGCCPFPRLPTCANSRAGSRAVSPTSCGMASDAGVTFVCFFARKEAQLRRPHRAPSPAGYRPSSPPRTRCDGGEANTELITMICNYIFKS